MKKFLISLDLDGTLLYDWETISETTLKYLLDFKNLGHKFIIATGRPFRSSEKFYDLLELDTPMINYNGGLVTSKHDPLFKPYSITINKEYILDIFENTKEHILNAFGEVRDDIYLLHDTEEIKPLLHNFNGARLFVGDFKDTLNFDTNGFIVIAKEGHGEYIESYVKKHYEGKVISRNWGSDYHFIIELFTPETNKGNGLKYIADYMGFPKENIIAFGDGHNDIEMLEYAGLGVAMSNAQDSLKEVADLVLDKSNKEDGLIKFLETLTKK